MPSVYPIDMLTGGILTWFGMFGAENASRYALQCICDLSMCCCCNYSLWLCFRGYAAMFDAWLFIFVWQVVSWHDLACLVHRMLLDICLPGGVLAWFGMICARCYTEGRAGRNKSTQQSRKQVWRFLHGSLSRVGKIILPIHPDNPHLTTTTRHVMVGITRSKVILFKKNIFIMLIAVYCRLNSRFSIYWIKGRKRGAAWATLDHLGWCPSKALGHRCTKEFWADIDDNYITIWKINHIYIPIPDAFSCKWPDIEDTFWLHQRSCYFNRDYYGWIIPL